MVEPNASSGAAHAGATAAGRTSAGHSATAVDHTSAGTSAEPSTAELITRLSEQTSRLVSDELKLAKAEMSEKAKHGGVGAGLFGAGGILALYGLGALITAGILALALVVPAWLSALIIAVVLFAIAGIAALMGKKQFKELTPAAPERTIENVKQDVQEIKEHRHHDGNK